MPESGPEPFPRQTEAPERYGHARAPAARPARRNIWPWLIIGVLLSFLIGLLASPWLEAEVRAYLPNGVQPPVSEARLAEVQALETRLAQLEARPTPVDTRAGTVSAERIAALEAASGARLQADSNLSAQLEGIAAELERVSERALAGDDRIRDLFLLGVMRRMLEAGRPLTPIEEQVAMRFRARDAAAVDALAAWSREPQTRRTLGARLPDLGRVAEAADAEAEGDWWHRLKTRLSSLVTVRTPVGEESPGSRDAVKATAAALRDDDLELGISEMARGPQNAATLLWIRDARLLLAAEVALDRLDAAALSTALPAVEPAPTPPTQAPLNAR